MCSQVWPLFKVSCLYLIFVCKIHVISNLKIICLTVLWQTDFEYWVQIHCVMLNHFEGWSKLGTPNICLGKSRVGKRGCSSAPHGEGREFSHLIGPAGFPLMPCKLRCNCVCKWQLLPTLWWSKSKWEPIILSVDFY